MDMPQAVAQSGGQHGAGLVREVNARAPSDASMLELALPVRA
jgi:hypothetical protein